jgi:hypothetical protein
MGDPETREKRSRKRKKNIYAKALREDQRYSPKVIDKRRYNRKKQPTVDESVNEIRD